MDTDDVIENVGDSIKGTFIATVIAFSVYSNFAANTVEAMKNETSDPDELYRVEQTWDENKPLVLQPVKPQPLAKSTFDLIPH